MAGIDIPISISDEVASPFYEMSKAVSDTTGQLRLMQEQLARPVKMPSENPWNETYRQTQRNTEEQRRHNEQISEGTNKMGMLVQKAKGLVAAYLGFQAVKRVIGLSDEFSQSNTRLGIMNDGLQKTEDLTMRIYQIAQRTRGSFSDINAAVSKLGILAPNAFKGNDELLKFNELMLKSFKISGAGAQEQSAAMYQLTQAMASGALQGDEFRSIRENAPMLAQAIQKELGSVDIKTASSKGMITNDVIKRALFNQADEIEARFNKMPYTFGDIVTRIKNNFIVGMAPMFKAINRLWNNKHVKSFVDSTVAAFYLIGSVGATVFNGLNSVVTFLGDHIRVLGPILLGITTAFLLYKGAIVATAIAKSALYALEGIYTAAMIVWTIVTGSMTAAQWGFNAALLACPLTWVVAAIILVITALYVLVGVYNEVTDSHVSATGIIAGSFMWLAAAIVNSMIMAYNTVAIVAEFVGNVFKHPVYSVKRLFYNLVINVLKSFEAFTSGVDKVATSIANAFVWAANKAIGAINWIISALNHIPGVDIGQISEIGSVSSISKSAGNLANKLKVQIDSEMPSDYEVVKQKEFVSTSDWMNKGYSFGEGMVKKVKSLTDLGKLNNDKFDPKELSKALKGADGGVGKAAKDTAKNTKKTADNTAAAIDDIRYLREMSERNAINRFTTAEINISVTNNNTVDSNVDLDGLTDSLATSLGQAVSDRLDATVDGHYSMA